MSGRRRERARWLFVVTFAAGMAWVEAACVYYLRVIYVLYMKPEVQTPTALPMDLWGRLAVLLAAGGTLLLGIWPSGLLDWLERATGGP